MLTESTSELRRELSRCTTLLAFARISPSVSALSVTPIAHSATPSTTTSLAIITTHHATWRRMATLLLDVRGRNNFGGQMQPLAQEIKTFGCEGVVVPLPGELGFQIATRR